jgi:hypothetical protein
MTVAPDGDALSITLAVTNRGTNSGQTTCRVMDPADRTGSLGGFMLSPTIGAGQTVEFRSGSANSEGPRASSRSSAARHDERRRGADLRG